MNQLARTGGTSQFGNTQTTITQRSTVAQNFAKPKRKKKQQSGKQCHEEKEFADLTTKKNLVNVHSKLERGMSELQKEIFPIMIMDRDPYSTSGSEIELLHPDLVDGTRKMSNAGSNASRRRSSFGSVAAENHAKHMMNNVNDKNIAPAMRNLLVNIDTDIIINKTMHAEDPIAAGNLRELLRIDHRIDQSKIGAARYMAASQRPGFAQHQESEEEEGPNTPSGITKKRVTRKSQKQTGDYDDEGDLSPLNSMRNLTPRMRHTRSYRCQSDKEISDLR